VIDLAGGVITLQSKGLTSIINPAYNPSVPGSPFRVNRDFGFGMSKGRCCLTTCPWRSIAGPTPRFRRRCPLGPPPVESQSSVATTGTPLRLESRCTS